MFDRILSLPAKLLSQNPTKEQDKTESTSTAVSSSDSATQETALTQTKDEVDALFADILQHEKHTSSSFDLLASNTCCSPQVRKIMGSALMNSCCLGLPGARFYGGCEEIDTIELKTRKVACELFGANYCEVQLLSGMMANIAAYNAMLPRTGCTVMASPSKHGGHYSHNAGGPLTRLFGANVVQTPWDPKTYNVNIEELGPAMATHKPTLLILGWSEMLFEHDLPAIHKICVEHDCKLMYDMSHVAGLIAGKNFQRDMMQYADIVASSTGKSLHSSDHGLVLYNDPSLTPRIREAVTPLLTSNTHFHETAALCMTLLEMKEFGGAFAKQVVANTQALAKELVNRGFKLLCPELGYSRSHQLIVDLNGLSGAQATKHLDAARIFANPQDLPNDTVASGATGLRLGTQVLTRRGYKERDMAAIAKALSDVLHKHKDAASVARFVRTQSAKFSDTVCYAFDSENKPALPNTIIMNHYEDDESLGGVSC